MLQTFYDVMISHGRWMLIPEGLGTTLLIAFCAILIGSVLGCVFAIFKISGSTLKRNGSSLERGSNKIPTQAPIKGINHIERRA